MAAARVVEQAPKTLGDSKRGPQNHAGHHHRCRPAAPHPRRM